MAERKLIDATEALQFTADNGAVYTLKVTNDGQLYFGNGSGVAASSDAVAMWKTSSYTTGAEYLKDLTGKGHHMRIGSVGKAQIIDKALVLPGVSGNYASTPDAVINRITSTGTIEGWIYLTAYSSASTVLTKGLSGSTWSYGLMVDGTGRLGYRGNGSDTWTSSSVPVPLGIWTHVAVTVSGTALAFFINGAQISTDTNASGLTSSTLAIRVGVSAGTSTEFNGMIGQAAVYPTVLASNLLLAHYQDGLANAGTRAQGDGAVVVFHPYSQSDLATSWTAATGEVWTIASASGADTNDPLYLPYAGTKYLYVPGTTGNYASVPDSAAVSVTGDIDIRLKVALTDWTPAGEQCFLAKIGSAGNQSYSFLIQPSGKLYLVFTSNGNSQLDALSSVAVGVADGSTKWVRVTLDVNNGAGGRDARFYTSDDGVTWTQLGTTQTTAGTTSIFDSTAIVEIGTGWGEPLDGNIYRAQIYGSIDGSNKVLDVDFTSVTAGPTSTSTTFTCTTGQTVTINRSTSGRKAVVVDRSLFLFGTDDYMETPSHQDFNFAANESFTVVAVYRRYGTPASTQYLLSKSVTGSGSQGWVVYNGTDGKTYGEIHDGTTKRDPRLTNAAAGVGQVAALRRNYSVPDVRVFVNGTSDFIADTTTGAISTSVALSLGRRAQGSYADFEFIGAAVWRRALTDTEIGYLAGEFGV